MNVKYSISRFAIAVPAAVVMLITHVACKDDFGYQNLSGQQIAFKVSASDTWHEGMSVDENAQDAHCRSIQPLSQSEEGTKLYLHTVVSDNPSTTETDVVSRGTPIRTPKAFSDTYTRFSLSGICYTGDYPDDESQNEWTTDYAYNLYYSTSTGNPVQGGRPLQWPSNGKVRFYAFAPVTEDFEATDGELTLSDSNHKGSPTLTYTVPKNVTEQIDLMTVCAPVSAATTPAAVELHFGHALTAVRIKCDSTMLAGTITEVSIANVYGTGTQVIGADTWETSDITTYEIKKDITLPNDGDKIQTPDDTPITGTDTDKLTFMLLPQTLPANASLTIKFTDNATGRERTLSASLAGHKWTAGKIVTYMVSPSSISIKPKLIFDKEDGAVIPYSGVWYDASYRAIAEITQGDVSDTLEIPDKCITLQYSFDNSTWNDCEYYNKKGLLTIASQPAYETMNSSFDKSIEGTPTTPYDLSSEKGTANCYMVDKAGYYSLPLVYGNGQLITPRSDALLHTPDHNDNAIASPTITGVRDAVLLWQDAPDLIDSVTVDDKDNSTQLRFRIREHTLAQGNAVLAVRNSDSTIVWSWHIWVTPHKTEFYTNLYNSQTSRGKYRIAQYNLGYCDRHAHNDARPFSLQAVIDMSAYGGKKVTTVAIDKTFMQMEFKGSAAGDNTYYQWGRKDPMLGGIYNDKTPLYRYKKKGTGNPADSVEFTMENKQVFNQHITDRYNYSFCKNPGDVMTSNSYGYTGTPYTDDAKDGVTIGYGIRHPYMFIANSRATDTNSGLAYNYRNHWHKKYDATVGYLDSETHIMYNVWDATAESSGRRYEQIYQINDQVTADTANLKYNASDVTKSLYDPCPPGFKVPPVDAFRGIAKEWSGTQPYYYGKGTTEFKDNQWTLTSNQTHNSGQTITFPATGVRNYALRTSEWKTVDPDVKDETFTQEKFYLTSHPAFRMLTFVSSATIAPMTDVKNAYQVMLFSIDNRCQAGVKVQYTQKEHDKPAMTCYATSSNSYGLPVRPIVDESNQK